jgi:2-polyprenyl-6-methoxyphenol hydroxylase-like FAD-dependent oxidoreductase
VNRVAREFSLAPREQATTEVGVSLDLPLRDAREQFEKQYFLHHIRREDGKHVARGRPRGTRAHAPLSQAQAAGIRPSGKSEDAVS